MYKRNAQGAFKHFDFFILDEISLQIAFCLAVAIRHNSWAYEASIYRLIGFFMIIADAFVLLALNSMSKVMVRGYFREAGVTFRHCFIVFSIVTIFMFGTQSGEDYSRIILFLTFLFHMVFGYLMRIVWKSLLKELGLGTGKRNMLVVTSSENAKTIVKQIMSGDELSDYCICGIVLTDYDPSNAVTSDEHPVVRIAGYPVVSNLEGVADYIVREWVDSVYIDALLYEDDIAKLMDACTLMGVPTHLRINEFSVSGVKRFTEKMGETTVLTTSINFVTPAQAFLKRLFDIIAGLIGSVIAILIILIIGPIIKIQSPGPILFRQERIGRNGRRFNIIKIRSMYMDAEDRKAEYMQYNKFGDGKMFKMDFDPKIIGNKITEDGQRKTGIGEFIRRTSLDEFPQFFLVLAGVMSTVGTRPPTVDEYNLYNYHHRARMAIKPGLTGLWQVSGRSNITDFEEVVRLDTEYISNWTLGMDMKIIFKTIRVVFTGKGAV